jgi:transposase InsO family protein
MVRFIALPKLPSAKEAAEVMMDQVFKIHGFPKYIVSDRGPQFVSRFWSEFCRIIGATASLTTGYHPEANSGCALRFSVNHFSTKAQESIPSSFSGMPTILMLLRRLRFSRSSAFVSKNFTFPSSALTFICRPLIES